jgi:hypothetical protein
VAAAYFKRVPHGPTSFQKDSLGSNINGNRINDTGFRRNEKAKRMPVQKYFLYDEQKLSRIKMLNRTKNKNNDSICTWILVTIIGMGQKAYSNPAVKAQLGRFVLII